MRKRSRYRPKGVRLDNLAFVLQGMQRVAQRPEALDLRIKNHAALANLVQGRGDRGDVDVMIAAMNVTEGLLMVNPDLGQDWRTEIRAAQDAILAMARRGVERERFLFTGPELTAINLAMEIHDVQLETATVAELERAMDRVAEEIRNRRARPVVTQA